MGEHSLTGDTLNITSIRRRIAGVIVLAVTVAATAVAAMPSTAATGFVTLKHKTGLSITVPRDYKMGFSRGVYVLKAPGRTLTFSRSVSGAGADQYGAALLQQLGGKVVFRAGGPAEFAAQINFGSRRDAFVILRGGGKLLITTSSSRVSSPLALEALRSIGQSARGGVSLRAPASAGGGATQSIALAPYRTPDGGATALVPTGPGWTLDGANGNILGFGTNGAFAFGLSANVIVPGAAPGPLPASIIVAPYMNAADALREILPRLFKVSNIQIRGIIHDAVFPTFTSSAMFRFDYESNGQAWTGAAIVGTDSPDKYGNIAWNFYYSGIGVRVGTDPSVGVGLLKSWKSWDPSGAIANRTAQQVKLIDETNQVWQQTAEFRSVTADRQARDVGCLLQGYYVIEDNSRKYDLPPLPCGQIYTER